jgi:hypothetical protein
MCLVVGLQIKGEKAKISTTGKAEDIFCKTDIFG